MSQLTLIPLGFFAGSFLHVTKNIEFQTCNTAHFHQVAIGSNVLVTVNIKAFCGNI